MTDDPRIPRGRLQRLGKLAALGAKVGGGLVRAKTKDLLGGDGDPRVETARRMLETLGEMKGAALKLGQTISLGADSLPPEVKDVVSRMFSQAPTLPWPEIRAQLEAELGRPVHEAFASIEETPFAGASIGQVHRARLHDGAEVAVKVQYPAVAGALEEDMKNAALVVKTLKFGGSLLDGQEYFEELRRELLLELDYRREASLIDEFRGYLQRFPLLVVPHVHPEVSTAKVLVTDRLEGPTLHAYCQQIDGKPAAERFAIGQRLVEAVYGPFFFDHVIYADTHPGNFLVLPDAKLGVVDFGSVKRLSPAFWGCYHEAFSAGLQGGHPDLPTLMRRGGFTIETSDEEARRVSDEIATIVGLPLQGPYDFGEDRMVPELLALKNRHFLALARIRPPPEAILFYRSVAGLAYNLRQLKARGDFRPFFADTLRELAGRPSA